MAKIKISEEEDWKLTHGTKRGLGLSRFGVINTCIIIGFIVIALLLRQYLFAAFVLFFVGIFVWLSRFGLRSVVQRRHIFNRFWNEELEVEFAERVFKVTLGLNKLTLAVADLNSLTERNGYYFLSHDSGINLVIPSKSLTTEEVCLLLQYISQIELKNREEKFRRSWIARRLTILKMKDSSK